MHKLNNNSQGFILHAQIVYLLCLSHMLMLTNECVYTMLLMGAWNHWYILYVLYIIKFTLRPLAAGGLYLGGQQYTLLYNIHTYALVYSWVHLLSLLKLGAFYKPAFFITEKEILHIPRGCLLVLGIIYIL